MKCGHLFNGIGGFALAAHWMGWENVFHCEIDDFCNKVMKKHFPNSIQHGNIKEQDFSSYRGTIDLLTGGFPCQPYSTAGKRFGKADERHLWPEMLRAIRAIQPSWIVGENVRGLTNWNGGLVFDEVQADLEAEGYEVLPFLLPAAGVGAPHRRDRIWFIAHTKGERWREKGKDVRGQKKRSTGVSGEWPSSDASKQGLQIRICDEIKSVRTSAKASKGSKLARAYTANDWREFPTQSPICGGNDGISDRVDQLKSLGNAVVPELVLQIFKAIESYEMLTPAMPG